MVSRQNDLVIRTTYPTIHDKVGIIAGSPSEWRMARSKYDANSNSVMEAIPEETGEQMHIKKSRTTELEMRVQMIRDSFAVLRY